MTSPDKKHISPLVAVTLCVASLFGCMRVEERFETVAAAREAGFFERGWLPDVLPDDAGPIFDQHDLDTNKSCSRSELPADALSEVKDALQALGFEPYESQLPEAPFRACPFSLEEVEGAALIVSRVSPRLLEFAAVSKNQGALFFWSVSPER